MKISESDLIWDQAAQWVDATLSGGNLDRAALSQWQGQSAEHVRAYEALLNVAKDNALLQALGAYDTAKVVSFRPKPKRHPLAWGIGAAVAASYVAAMVFVFREPLELSLVPKTVYETRAGQLQTVALSDGSQVFLNGGTRLEVRISKHYRSAHLSKGEAFFDIRHDLKRPFNVDLAQGRVEDLGTQFDISYVADSVEVSVYEGRVRLNGRKAYGELAPGQRGQLTHGNVTMLSGFDPAGGDWRQGWIEPQDWPLERVTEALSRHSGLPITIEKTELRHKRIAGRLRLDDPQQQLANLALIHGFHVEKRGAGLVID